MNDSKTYQPYTYTGICVAIAVLICWFALLLFLLNWHPLNYQNPLIYLSVIIQTHLYTGLFITAHDAMHGSISPKKWVNTYIGQLCTFLYAGFHFRKLTQKHQLHHQFVHTSQDPDYQENRFWKWYFKFMLTYVTLFQIIIMAAIFNLLKIFFSIENLLLFMVLPSLLSTLQLFYFGTWQPHHGEHQNKHQSGTLAKNHFLAFITCYFFGYHYEHHDAPKIPWWQLYKTK